MNWLDEPNGNRWLSWRDLIDLAPELGVPHFQRGHVWDRGNVAALLESMLEGSPCGSMVLWRATSMEVPLVADIGESLVRLAAEDVRYWLIDGQQRVRSLLGIVSDAAGDAAPLASRETRELLGAWKTAWQVPPVFRGIAGSEGASGGMMADGDDAGDVNDAGRTWFVSLPRLYARPGDSTGLWTEDDRQRAARASAFRRLQRALPTREKKVGGRVAPPNPRGLVPLGVVLARSEQEGWNAIGELATETDRGALERLLPWVPHCLTGYGDSTWAEILGDFKQARRWRLLAESLVAPEADPLRRFSHGRWFAVGLLPEGCSFDDAISAYVRINRAGVRVKAEERAFADLVRRIPDVSKELRRYSDVRAERMWGGAGATSSSHDRRWLAHASERSFGFALWMKAVVRNLTIGLVPGSAMKPAWHGTETIERWTMQDKLGNPKPAERERMMAAPSRASAILLVLDQVLSQELGLDNPMALPDTRCLLPMIDLLARHEDLLDGDATWQRERDFLVGHLLLWLMIHPYFTQADLTDLMTAAALPDSAAAIESMLRAVHAIYAADAKRKAEVNQSVEAIVAELVDLVGDRFELQCAQARTLRDRAVGLLYGLERRMRDARGEAVASEFAWSQLGKAGSRVELPLRARWAIPPEGLAPEELALERQHIVPFSLAGQLVTKKPATRNVASDVNSVANLTWLTKRQNTFDGGFGADMVDLAVEPHERLAARGLSGAAKDAYGQIHQSWIAANESGWRSTEAEQAAFVEFRKVREEWIVRGMRAWLAEAMAGDAWARRLAAVKRRGIGAVRHTGSPIRDD